MAMSSSREARRRRIVDKGSDRLALITGRIQTFSPSSFSPEASYQPHTTSSPPSISYDHDLSDHDLSDQPSYAPPQSERRAFSSLLSKLDYGAEPAEHNSCDGVSGERPFMPKLQTDNEAFRARPLEFDGGQQTSLLSSTVQNASISTFDTAHRFETQNLHHKIFTSSQINSAIAATERTRISCSLAAAVLVVLSYIGFPVLSSLIIKGIILSRPLFVVLLTNISIVLARLLLEKERGSERAEQHGKSVSSMGGNNLADQVGKALESGLMLQSIIGALFVDSSVYATAVICGVSLAQRLGC